VAGTGQAGWVDGPSDTAQFTGPFSVFSDSISDELYVTDFGNYRLRKITSKGIFSTSCVLLYLHYAGQVITLAGNGVAGCVDGLGLNASFNYPAGFAIDSTNQCLYVCDRDSHKIHKVAFEGIVKKLCLVNCF
jgi:DNA-binding beta-propeller fold protein YncE